MTFGKLLSKEKLNTEYWNNKKSPTEIASDFNCDGRTILKWMVRYGVPRRKPGERANGEFTLKKGHIPWDKGMKGLHFSGQVRFKKGNIPWNKGKKGLQEHTDEWKRKISERVKGEKHPMYGKHHTEETREKMIKSHIGLQKRENHPNWKGGITPLTKRIRRSFEYRQWRSDVFTRDDFTCQECNRRSGYLHAHHKKPFALIFELNDITTFEQAQNCAELWNINNGITYCRECHKGLKGG